MLVGGLGWEGEGTGKLDHLPIEALNAVNFSTISPSNSDGIVAAVLAEWQNETLNE